ncbi:MAG: signal peptidase I [Pseudomonadota bacterium]
MRRRPWLALLLGGLCPGLGHLYAGSAWTAVVVPVLATLAVAALGYAAAEGVLGPLGWLVGTLTIPLATRGLAPWHALWLARRPRPAQPWQRAWVYLAFFVLTHLGTWAGVRLCRAFFVEPYRVPSASMAPSVLPGDVLLVSRRPAGDLRSRAVLFAHEGVVYVKRAVAGAGATVEVRRERVRVDGRDLPRVHCSRAGDLPNAQHGAASAYVETGADGRDYLVQWGPPLWSAELDATLVPAGALFVLGDNRDDSVDSRHWGPIMADQVLGVALGIIASVDPLDGRPRWERFGQTLEPEVRTGGVRH